MPSINQALRHFDLPRLEARLLLAQVTGLSHAAMVSAAHDELSAEQWQAFSALAARRLAGEPVAYLLGAREFYGREFAVTPAVLIPRPETEHLVEATLAKVGRMRPARVVDLGTGSGIIACTLALEAPQWQVAAVDLSADALQVARGNAARLGAQVAFHHGSWLAPLPAGERFDAIVSNPPYIEQHDHHLDEGDVRFEPRMALTDENDGLDCLRAIVAAAPARLLPGGWLLLEHGYDQGAACRALLVYAGFVQVATLPDLAGNDRVTLGQLA
ncbi:peptide chain release factor N(5)-glutamine methyltransferase [Vogesella sp. LIG4]|uniref:peptide chain release factor N(5)-glutamine methyltransferase n=1 Tax=Vogesella sp. LIG4 TaxID=1192162 RepID=UPI00081FFF76|nr:peptide chain release factor N(5)-glutamine methyltransferase [Vogesella sp. LIG4]SCK17367.1 release factor glutamine methyltransferase [Vogesella sp. LIG4]